jgi:dihydrofolate reductase
VGKIVNATNMTIDGDIQNLPDWHFEYFGDDARRTATGQLFTADALVMGRETYDGFASAWAEQAGTNDFADRMNSIRKYVVSTTLTDPAWENTTVIGARDAVADLRALRDEDGTVLQYGFGAVTRLLLDNGLLDELRIWLHPVFSGKALPSDLLFHERAKTSLTLAGVETHGNGMVVLTYRQTVRDSQRAGAARTATSRSVDSSRGR